MLTQLDVQPYRTMRAMGASPVEVYVAAFWDHQKYMRRRDILMQVFGLSEAEAMSVSAKAEIVAFGKYAAMRDSGQRPEAIVRAAVADGHNPLDTVVILIHLFDMNGRDAHRIVKNVR